MQPDISKNRIDKYDKDYELRHNMDEIQSYINKIREYKSARTSAVGKSISSSAFEIKNIITPFLQENNISINDFLKIIFYKDNLLPNSLIVALDIERSTKTNFLDFTSFAYNYKDTGENINDQKEALLISKMQEKEDGKQPPKISISLPKIILDTVEKEIEKREFSSFSQYFKEALIAYYVYPTNLVNYIQSHTHTVSRFRKGNLKAGSNKTKVPAKPKTA